MFSESIFKAYDIRGIYPTEINEEAAKKVAKAFAKVFGEKKVAVGRDVHLASPKLQQAMIEGLVESGVDVVDIGPMPTDGLYFASGYYDIAGLQATASHLPREYGGIKMVKKGAVATDDADLAALKKAALENDFIVTDKKGLVEKRDAKNDYLNYIAKLFDLRGVPPLKVVANANYGLDGLLIEEFLKMKDLSQIEIIKLNFEPNGEFPKGRPDPLIPENRTEVEQLIVKEKADLGVAWDADGDRCYVFDEKGGFVEGCHLTALLAEHYLKLNPGEKIVYEFRNRWAVENAIKDNGGIPVPSRTGHVHMKVTMRKENAIFGGEMSGHIYYRDFYYADSGLLTSIVFLDLLSRSGKKVSEIVDPLRKKYIVSGEYNFIVNDKQKILDIVESKYNDGEKDFFEGLSVSYGNWRFNLRPSVTESLAILRLNVEAKDEETCKEKTVELVELLGSLGKAA